MEELDYLTKSVHIDASRVPGDWVKDVFAPIFGFDAIVAAGKDGYKDGKSKIQRVPILDPLTIKEVFDRVHERVVTAERKQFAEVEEQKVEAELKRIDPRQSSIWNTEELETLRNVYKSAKGEITKLEVALREKTTHVQALELTVQKQRLEIGVLASKLSEAKKSNQRLVIHRDQLYNQNAVLNLKCAALKDAWIEIGTEKQKSMEAEKIANLALDKQRLLGHKLETNLAEAKQNLIRETYLTERNVTTKFEIELNDLNEVIRDLTLELQEERRIHDASKRGLDHLRQHFSSLPLGDILPPNAVDRDQIGLIDHCSL